MYGVLFSGNNLSEEILLLLILSSLYMGIAYLTNNIFDREGDAINLNKYSKNPFIDKLERKNGILMLLIMVAAFLILCLVKYNMLFWLTSITGILLAIGYSMPPLRFKEKAPLDLFSHAFFFGILPFLIGFYFANTSYSPPIFLTICIALYSMVLEMRNELKDYFADQAAGYKTTAVVIGYDRSVRLLSLLVLSSIFTMFLEFYTRIGIYSLPILLVGYLSYMIYTKGFNQKTLRKLDLIFVILFILLLLIK